jgi:hypothetical protein
VNSMAWRALRERLVLKGRTTAAVTSGEPSKLNLRVPCCFLSFMIKFNLNEN